MANTLTRTDERGEIQELPSGEMKDVAGGAVYFSYEIEGIKGEVPAARSDPVGSRN